MSINQYRLEDPLELVKLSLDEKVIVKMKGDRELYGKLHAFDQHLNMLMGNVEETIYTSTINPISMSESITNIKRAHEMLFVRGDCVILLSPALPEQDIAEQDLQKIESKYNEECLTSTLTVDTEFEYGWALVRSSFKEDRQKGIKLLTAIKNSYPSRERDALYYLAIGNYKLGQYKEAKECVKKLLQKEPGNQQVGNLEELIDSEVKKKGLVGIGIVGGISAVAVASLASWIFSFSKSSSKDKQ